MNVNEIIGYFVLSNDEATKDRLIYNPQYVAKVGMYVSRLKLLKYRVADETRRAHLQECYQNHLFSAMFWAVYPMDVSKLTSAEKKSIQQKLNYASREIK